MAAPEEPTSNPDRPTTPPQRRPSWVEINLDNLVHNLGLVRALEPGVAIMPAVKANAYGHGAVECAAALEEAGADWFAVALPEEGAALRDAGITRPILCLSGFWDGQEELLIAKRLTPAIYAVEQLRRLDVAARRAGTIVDYHFKVDTGMRRLGACPQNVEAFLTAARSLSGVRLDGIMTHLASADDPAQHGFTEEQLTRFDQAVAMVNHRGFTPKWVHQANSAAIQAYPGSRGNLVRPGGVIYGLWRDVTSSAVEPLDWRPVLSLHSRIMLLKQVPAGSPLGYGGTFVTRQESLIGTIPIGYADGLPRALSNQGRVLVRGDYVPIVGRVSMDLTLIDVTAIDGVSLGDQVTLIGSQGEREITAEETAGLSGTISYEVTCGIGPRLARVYTSRPE